MPERAIDADSGPEIRLERKDVFATEEVLRAKPGLRGSKSVLLALILDCGVG